ncbi:MAG: tyrosine recombinase [Rickettsiales bacterium]
MKKPQILTLPKKLTKELEAYLSNFLEMLAAERFASKNTLSSYKLDLIDLLLLLPKELTALLQPDLEDYFITLSKRGLSSRSIARKISAVKQFFKFLTSEKIIPQDVAMHLELPKLAKLLPKALDVKQIEQMLSLASQDVTPEGLRLYAMLQILYSTGLRITELINLKITSLVKESQVHGSLLVIIIKGKGGKERQVVLNASAILAMQNYMSVRHEFLRGQKSDILFPSFDQQGRLKPLTRQRFHQLIKELAIISGIDPKVVSCHKVRHSFATHLLSNGADLRVIQELMGHSDIASTQIYTKVANSHVQEEVFAKHPLGFKR